MIKQVLHKTSSVSIALLVLFSTVSFTIEKHFCGDVLIDVSVFLEVEKCQMEVLELLQKKTCCKDEIDIFQGQDKLNITSFDDLDFDQQQFILAFVYTYINGFESLPKETIPHKNYSPPNLITDIQVLDQIFII